MRVKSFSWLSARLAPQEIALANAGNLVSGKDASIVAVDFTTDPNSVKLITGQHTASNAMRPTGASLQ